MHQTYYNAKIKLLEILSKTTNSNTLSQNNQSKVNQIVDNLMKCGGKPDLCVYFKNSLYNFIINFAIKYINLILVDCDDIYIALVVNTKDGEKVVLYGLCNRLIISDLERIPKILVLSKTLMWRLPIKIDLKNPCEVPKNKNNKLMLSPVKNQIKENIYIPSPVKSRTNNSTSNSTSNSTNNTIKQNTSQKSLISPQSILSINEYCPDIPNLDEICAKFARILIANKALGYKCPSIQERSLDSKTQKLLNNPEVTEMNAGKLWEQFVKNYALFGR